MRSLAAPLLTVLWFGVANVAPGANFHFVTLDFPPLEFANDRDEPDGAAVEIVTEVMKRLGHTVTIEILPWSRSLNLVKIGKADAIFTAYKNADRETFLDYSKENLVSQVVALYAKKDSGFTFNGDFKPLKANTFGILNEISYGQKFDKAKTKLKLKTERVEKLDLNFKKLAAGRIDFVISNRYSAEVEIEALKLRRDIIELPTAVEVTPSYIAFSKKKLRKGLRDDFDRELRAFKESGQYQVILDKFRVRAPNL